MHKKKEVRLLKSRVPPMSFPRTTSGTTLVRVPQVENRWPRYFDFI